MTGLHVTARPRTTRCWQLDRHPDDDYSPHYTTEDEALTEAEMWVEDGQPIPAVTRLPAPCWVAACAACAAEVEHVEYGTGMHYDTARDVDDDAPDLACADGCPPPEPTYTDDPSRSMDPLPGLGDRGGVP